jgi:nicotinate phosphoribosyltransferase
MVLAAPDMLLADFGLRRAHSAEAGLLAARACYLAGFAASATVPAEPIYGVPIIGTMAHSFVQAHHDEASAFLDFARARPDNVVLLIDTYDVEKGTRKAISVAPILEREGIKLAGVRIDSGDLAAHAVRVRAMLDEAGLSETRIFVSGGLDEWELRAFTGAGAPIDGAGVGTSLTTSEDAPAFDCAYKLQEYAGAPKRKQSERKATWPGRKQVYRRADAAGTMTGDLIALADETAEGERLVEPVMRDGARLGALPDLEAARERARADLACLPEHLQALETQPPYPVEISSGLQRVAEQVDAEIARERDKTPGPVEG